MGEEIISNLQKKGEGEVLIIDGETIFEESDIDGNGMYLYVFYCLFFKGDTNGYVGGTVDGIKRPHN